MIAWRHESAGDAARIQAMADALKLPSAVAAILVRRGLAIDAAAALLNPRLADLSDPFRLPDMPSAVDRLWHAIDNRERITVFGDYDADGITAAALTAKVLKALGAELSVHLPHRVDEGYGFSEASLARCIEETRPELIVTVDCGSCSAATVTAARAAGIDVVVTDHHELLESPAPAVAVVNPRRCDVAVPPAVASLAGVGVAFKLCHAVVKAGRQRGHAAAAKLDLRRLLELVAVGTIADVVPLLGENRILTAAGLKQINRQPGTAVEALIKVAGTRLPLTSRHVAFTLAPRLNAAGRLGDARAALDLLLSDHPADAARLAGILDAANRQRRGLVETILDDAETQIAAMQRQGQPSGIVVGHRDWHVGVIGIVAARIVERYRRPAVVVSFDSTGHGRGSARSLEPFHLLEGLQACSDHLLTFGGHAMAAGLAVHTDAFDAFRHAFNRTGGAILQGVDPSPVLTLDGWLTPADINDDLADALERLTPFGEAHEQPVWAMRGVRICGSPRVVGERHLKMMIECEGKTFDTIGFNMGDRELGSNPLDIAFHLQRNEFRGRINLQLQLQDIRASTL